MSYTLSYTDTASAMLVGAGRKRKALSADESDMSAHINTKKKKKKKTIANDGVIQQTPVDPLNHPSRSTCVPTRHSHRIRARLDLESKRLTLTLITNQDKTTTMATTRNESNRRRRQQHATRPYRSRKNALIDVLPRPSPAPTLIPYPVPETQTRPIVLVLGMANVNEEFLHKLNTRPETTYGNLRDHLRLELLEQQNKIDIITMNDKQSIEDCYPHKHYQGSFSSRCAQGLRDTYGQDLVLTGGVFLDYFRFPPGYMAVAYENFGPLLRGLIERNLLPFEHSGPNSKGGVYAPNFPQLAERLHHQFQRREAKPLVQIRSDLTGQLFHQAVYLFYQPWDMQFYPLWDVTEQLWQSSPGAITDRNKTSRRRQPKMIADALGGFIHAHEIKQLNPHAPFVRITITTDEVEARKSFDATFRPTEITLTNNYNTSKKQRTKK